MPRQPQQLSRAALWQGFRHAWGYNHRLNRLGSRVVHLSGGRAETRHSGASGTGADTLTYLDRSMSIEGSNLRFVALTVPLRIRSKEGMSEVRKKRVRFELGSTERVPIAAVLNGFDLCSKQDADKLLSLRIAVRDLDQVGTTVSLTVDAMLNVDCDSLECDLHGPGELFEMLRSGTLGFRKKGLCSTDYRLVVDVLVVLAPPGGATAEPLLSIQNRLSWKRKMEPHGEKTLTKHGAVDWRRPVAASAGVVGITSLGVTARGRRTLRSDPADLHMRELDLGLTDVEVSGGEVRGRAELFFGNWAMGMRQHHALSFPQKGTAALQLDTVFIGLPEAVCHLLPSPERTLTWAGQNKTADHADAVARVALDLSGPVQV